MAITVYRVCTHFWTELWRRCRLEFTVELPMLQARWKAILLCIALQYVHGLFAQLAHRLHKPLPAPLEDLGFKILPELGEKRKWVSEYIFVGLIVVFVMWTLSPFVVARKRFYTIVLYTRLLVVLVTCQALRIASFSVTRLPAPNYHCRAGQATAMRAWPKHWSGHLIFDFRRAMLYSCGDLIFSSHTTFALSGALAYNEYGSFLPIKVLAWTAVALLSLAIVASRKHYSVDVLVAWWTVPLVFYAYHRRWTISRPVMEEEERFGVPTSLPQFETLGSGRSPFGSHRGARLPSIEMSVTPAKGTGLSHSLSAQNLHDQVGEGSTTVTPQRRGSFIQLQMYGRGGDEDDVPHGGAPQTPSKLSTAGLCRIS